MLWAPGPCCLSEGAVHSGSYSSEHRLQQEWSSQKTTTPALSSAWHLVDCLCLCSSKVSAAESQFRSVVHSFLVYCWSITDHVMTIYNLVWHIHFFFMQSNVTILCSGPPRNNKMIIKQGWKVHGLQYGYVWVSGGHWTNSSPSGRYILLISLQRVYERADSQ